MLIIREVYNYTVMMVHDNDLVHAMYIEQHMYMIYQQFNIKSHLPKYVVLLA